MLWRLGREEKDEVSRLIHEHLQRAEEGGLLLISHLLARPNQEIHIHYHQTSRRLHLSAVSICTFGLVKQVSAEK